MWFWIAYDTFASLSYKLGLMYWWNVTLNAISLVNLVMASGISVEFTSHILRSYAVSLKETKIEQAYESVIELVFSFTFFKFTFTFW